jgi:hypothetical protein
VSAQLTWRALDEADNARTAANRPAFLPQTLAFSAQTFLWSCNLHQERYNFLDPAPKKEIPVPSRSIWLRLSVSPGMRVACSSCGEEILNQREFIENGPPLCRSCAGDRYWSPKA